MQNVSNKLTPIDLIDPNQMFPHHAKPNDSGYKLYNAALAKKVGK